MIFTTDDRYLISTSRDASIAIWKVNDDEDGSLKIDQGTVYPKLILIPKSDVEKKNCLISKLEIRIEELEKEIEHRRRLKILNYNNRINAMYEYNNRKIENLKIKNEILENNKSKQEAEYTEQISHIKEKQSQNLQLIESITDKKLLKEDENVKTIPNMLIAVEEKNKREIKELEEKQEILLDQLIEEYEGKLVDLEKKREQCTENILLQQKEFEEMQNLIEIDAEMELVSRKTDFERLLFQERHFASKLKDENSVLKKEVLDFSTKLKIHDEDRDNYKLRIEVLNTVVDKKQNWIDYLQEVLQLRDRKPQGEEKHFYDMVLENTRIVKLKTDLEFKHIIELKQHLQEREAEINAMRATFEIMQCQLEKITHQLHIVDFSARETKQKLVATSRKLDRIRKTLSQKSAVLHTFYSDLIGCISFIDDHQKLKGSIIALCEKYNQKNIKKIIASYKNRIANIHKKWDRQRYNFEYMVHKLKIETKATVKKCTLQNCLLTAKINNNRGKLLLEREKEPFFAVLKSLSVELSANSQKQ
ncbi:ciliaflagella57-likeassociated and flagella-associated 57-like [Octopus vulgaris]|uniref:Ciliaflagella57-likeassociated and flagella-associated 57-like n=1 Tax=Octopus vulgaris TaxID=6645 RepID=A0AA36BRP7_OCTVU|nr:ciliaflagella57-likeassociated and flagella-associated 57-like [Octopus vulgaris]